MFDALYDLVRQKRPLEQPLVNRLNQTNGLLAEPIQAAVRELRQRHLERQQLLK